MQRYKHILLTTGLVMVCAALVCISVRIYANAVSAGILTKKDELKVVVPIVDIPKTFRGMEKMFCMMRVIRLSRSLKNCVKSERLNCLTICWKSAAIRLNPKTLCAFFT